MDLNDFRAHKKLAEREIASYVHTVLNNFIEVTGVNARDLRFDLTHHHSIHGSTIVIVNCSIDVTL